MFSAAPLGLDVYSYGSVCLSVKTVWELACKITQRCYSYGNGTEFSIFERKRIMMSRNNAASGNSSLISHLSSFISRSSRLRFTLVELLVVIAIISILASMLLPAMNMIKHRSTSVTCMSNQKNCIMALNSYANNNLNLYPAAFSRFFHSDNNREYDDFGWAGILMHRGYLPRKQKKANNVIQCPMDIRDEHNLDTNADMGSNYTYGLITGTAGASADLKLGPQGNHASGEFYHVNRTRMAKPQYSRIPLGGDSIDIAGGYQCSSLTLVGPTTTVRARTMAHRGRHVHTRHLGKANLFHVDGHVSSYGKADITAPTWLAYAAQAKDRAGHLIGP